MEHFPRTLSREQSDAMIKRIEDEFEQNGFGLWAVEVRNVAPFVGFVGLSVPRFNAHFTPCIEIGWRIASRYWNRGYATEAARGALGFGFEPQMTSIIHRCLQVIRSAGTCFTQSLDRHARAHTDISYERSFSESGTRLIGLIYLTRESCF
jgi:hypothetical protein